MIDFDQLTTLEAARLHAAAAETLGCPVEPATPAEAHRLARAELATLCLDDIEQAAKYASDLVAYLDANHPTTPVTISRRDIARLVPPHLVRLVLGLAGFRRQPGHPSQGRETWTNAPASERPGKVLDLTDFFGGME